MVRSLPGRAASGPKKKSAIWGWWGLKMADEAKLIFRMEASIAGLEKTLARAEARVNRYANDTDRRFRTSNRALSDGVSRAASDMGKLTGVSNQQRAAIQNMSFQFQDMAVQIAGGTSASRAMAQQLPQLLGGLGLVGALAGTAATVFIPLAAHFLSAGDEAVSLADRLKALDGAMRALKSANSEAEPGVLDMIDQYGRFAGQAEKVYEIRRKMAQVAAESALMDVSRGLSSAGVSTVPGAMSAQQMASLKAEYAALGKEVQALAGAESVADMQRAENMEARRREIEQLIQSSSEYRRQLAEMLGDLGVAIDVNANLEAAERINAALMQLRDASGPEEQAAAMARLRDAMYSASEGGKLLSEEGKKVFDSLSNAEISALALAAVDMASPIGAAGDEAARLAGNLAAAVANAGNIVIPGLGRAGSLPGKGLAALSSGANSAFGWLVDQTTSVLAPSTSLRPRRAPIEGKETAGASSGGGGGGGAKVSADQREAQRIIEQTRTAAEKLTAELTKLQRLKDAGLIDEETFQRAKHELEGVSAAAKDAASAIKSAFMGLFDDPIAALEDLSKQLLQILFFQQLAKSVPSVFGAGGIIPLGYASGGYTGQGGVNQPAGVVHRGEVVWSQRDIANAGGVAAVEAMRRGLRGYAGGGFVSTSVPNVTRGGGSVFQIIDQRSAGSPEIQRETRRGPDGREIVTAIVREEMGRGTFDGSMSRFGAKPKKLVR